MLGRWVVRVPAYHIEDCRILLLWLQKQNLCIQIFLVLPHQNSQWRPCYALRRAIQVEDPLLRFLLSWWRPPANPQFCLSASLFVDLIINWVRVNRRKYFQMCGRLLKGRWNGIEIGLDIPKYTGLSSLGVPGVPWLADQLTLYQPRGADYAHQMILAPLDFQTFRRPWVFTNNVRERP